ncbi:hypothetical protein [Streptomyces sp. JNUCC 63]
MEAIAAAAERAGRSASDIGLARIAKLVRRRFGVDYTQAGRFCTPVDSDIHSDSPLL